MNATSRILATTLVAGAALSFASFGVAQDRQTTTRTVSLSDFDGDAEILGVPEDTSKLTFYYLAAGTEFRSGPGGDLYPPTPCKGLATSWNDFAAQDKSAPEETRQTHFRVLLSAAVHHECNFSITSFVDNGEIVGLSPTP